MKITGKITSLVAILSAAVLVVGALGLFVVLQYQSKTSELMNISERAYQGEHLNRLVTTVVMDARGIYAAKSKEGTEQFGKGMLASLDNMDETIAAWRKLIPAQQVDTFNAMEQKAKEFRSFRTETIRLGREEGPPAANLQGNNEGNRTNRKNFQKEIDKIITADKAELKTVQASLARFRLDMMLIIVVTSLVAVIASIVIGLHIGLNHLSRPIRKLTEAMKIVASGDYNADAPFIGRQDEIGEMADTVEVFKRNGLEVNRMNEEERALRGKSDDLQSSMSGVVTAAAAGDFTARIEKQYDDVNLDRFAANINGLLSGVDKSVTEVGRIMGALAAGNLTQEMTGQFAGIFEELQANVNTTLSSLRDIIVEVRHKADAINGNSQQLSSAAGDLSQRTERQAAALEQTSAALEQITSVVRNTSDRAQEASKLVGEAKENSQESATIVREAVTAMERIEHASSEISNIIGVIDEIAFQTNLLALNAGVEAARAGEAGKGFAVVAQEVRELAQRSANAAKDIKALITKSGQEVAGGVRLVQKTGASLTQIESRVLEINDHIQAIASAAKEQATGLNEVSTAINQMDQVTQQNAAMVEETSAATQKLHDDAVDLTSLLQRFNTGTGQSRMAPVSVTPHAPVAAPVAKRASVSQPRVAGKTSAPVASPARQQVKSLQRAFSKPSSGPATAARKAEDNWEEF
ncbi:methyl-accepting chemotaxis protein [Allorhizobium sp. BGMRC 0089]|uniref:HAMP domain-containing methyl-accepting chemotaxis protein n=1 Tax=Allorhizobium sonneratiae TaxID=2934936 RepID=UPI0020331F23|nr:methyl-accepting chemotaxis protein [Allorhizobium sonneratiae]MCM2290864.1 methyl-accepting chemotaxis protein [Allorhizobium sonneratiae]